MPSTKYHPPRVSSALTTGAGSGGQWGPGYMTPSNRVAEFNIAVDWNNIPSLPERLDEDFKAALMFHLKDAAQRVIDTARHYLVRLEEPAQKTSIYGTEIHGYDTGLMYVSLLYDLAERLLALGVFYELRSDAADYWKYVEFGHWVFSHKGPWFWPGYHFLETAIEENEPYIRQRVREAWADTAIKLGVEARVSGKSGVLGFQPW